MSEVVVYSSRLCGYCHAAKHLLESKGVEYREINVDGNAGLRTQLMERSGQRTVPQIWIDDLHVGGYTDLARLDQQGELNNLLGADQIGNNRPGF